MATTFDYILGKLRKKDVTALPDLGLTATATELNYVDGVTSAIQTQINTKVTGPVSATDNAVVRFDGTTGKLVQNSGVTITDGGFVGVGGTATSAIEVFQTSTTQIGVLRLNNQSTNAGGTVAQNFITDQGDGLRSRSVLVSGLDGSNGGYLAIQTRTAGTLTEYLRVNAAGGTVFGGPARLKGYTVATLPAGTQGDTAFVTDALAPTFLATLVGGGAVVTPCFYNGSAWVSY